MLYSKHVSFHLIFQYLQTTFPYIARCLISSRQDKTENKKEKNQETTTAQEMYISAHIIVVEDNNNKI